MIEAVPSVLVERCNDAGDLLGVVQLDAEYFGAHVNVPLLHQVVTAQLAAKRSGTHSTKTRSEVRGGGAKPYRQKGTGRARQGTIRAPQFTGGGIAFGPKPRDYTQSTPRKMVRQALRAALSDRAAEGRISLVDRWSYEVPRTKRAASSLQALGLDGKVLVVLGAGDVIAERSFGNLPHVSIVEAGQLTAYDVVASDWVVFTDDTVPGQVSDAPEGAVVLNSPRPVRPRADVAPSTTTLPRPTVDDSDAETACRRRPTPPTRPTSPTRPRRRRRDDDDDRDRRRRRVDRRRDDEAGADEDDRRRDRRRGRPVRRRGGGGPVSGDRSILLRPVISEKSYALMDEHTYVFVVDPRASKIEIRAAVEDAFGVRVASVNTMNRKGKRKRQRRVATMGKRPDTKRAIVRLVGDDRIELFES